MLDVAKFRNNIAMSVNKFILQNYNSDGLVAIP